jgi:hypothetical protein
VARDEREDEEKIRKNKERKMAASNDENKNMKYSRNNSINLFKCLTTAKQGKLQSSIKTTV